MRNRRKRLASTSLSERRRQCRKRTHLRVVHRSKLFNSSYEFEDSDPSPDL